jgi:hypothetical protein
MSGCKEEEIVVYNTQVTPNLDNPIIQKITNITWYRQDFNSSSEEWKTKYNIPKQAEHIASLLYTMAWANITLYRDGTSVMLFVPPMFANTYLHCKGKWKVSETEENTIIVTTKTPVSNTSFKMKVLFLETKDNVGTMSISMDFGNRVIDANLLNMGSTTTASNAADFNWYAENPVSTTALNLTDFENRIWGQTAFRLREHTPIDNDEFISERTMRSDYVYDILTYTPQVLGNMLAFHLDKEGKAFVYYGAFTIFNWIDDSENRLLYSDATWYIKGNKIIIETDEEFFQSLGENMFSLSIDETQFQTHGQLGYNPYHPYMKVRTQKNYYAIEIIRKEENGYRCRITTRDGMFYTFLFNRSDLEIGEKVNIKDVLN